MDLNEKKFFVVEGLFFFEYGENFSFLVDFAFFNLLLDNINARKKVHRRINLLTLLVFDPYIICTRNVKGITYEQAKMFKINSLFYEEWFKYNDIL